MSIAKRVKSITPSMTLQITAKANKMKEEGISIIGFGAGEPDFNTPEYIIDAAKAALDAGMTKYTPSSGTLKLRQAIVKKFKEDNNLEYSTKNIIVSNGAKHSLYNAILSIINPLDEVLIPSPYWVTYPELVILADGVPKFIQTTDETDFKITPKQLEKAITKKTKALIFNSPSNPTGSVYTKDEIYALAEVIEKSGIYVISDEIYEKLVYDDAKHYSIATYSEKVKQKTIVINGMSKTYSMTGWRIGYLAAPLDIASAIDSMQSHATSNPNSIAQHASCIALDGGQDFLQEMKNTFNERRKYMIDKITHIKDITCTRPKGAFYIFMNVSSLFGKSSKGRILKGSLDVTEMMLDYGVAVVPGVAFGADDYVRLSYAISMQDIKEGLDRIEKFVNDVK